MSGTNGDRVVIVMVGLPARGKTYIARKIARYLSFFHGAPTETFNVGEYRRRMAGTKDLTHKFFAAEDVGTSVQREEFAAAAMADLKAFITADSSMGRVAIFDGTNSNIKRRAWILEELRSVLPTKNHVLFVESICRDKQIIESNIRATKLHSPDYEGWSEDAAVADFNARIGHYERAYESLDDISDGPAPDVPLEGQTDWGHDHLSWIKLIDCGRQVRRELGCGRLLGWRGHPSAPVGRRCDCSRPAITRAEAVAPWGRRE